MNYIPEPSFYSLSDESLVTKAISANLLSFFYVKQNFYVLRNKKSLDKVIELSAYLKNGLSNEPVFSISYKVNGSIICNCKYCNINNNLRSCYHTSLLIKSFNKEEFPYLKQSKQDIDSAFLYEEDRIKEQERLKIKEENLKDLLYLKEELKTIDILPSISKIHLTPKLLITNQKDNLKVELNILVGKVNDTKTYVVKNLVNFIMAIRNNTEISYGKSFTFNHNINNFDDISKKLILIIESNIAHKLNDTFYSSSVCIKGFDVSQMLLDNIFELYLNKNIVLDYKDEYACIVTDKEQSIMMEVKDDNLVLKNIDTQIYLSGVNYDYIYDFGLIKRVKGSSELRKIAKYLIINDGLSIENIHDEFAVSIYSRFSDVIEVSDEFKIEFNIKDLDIEAYFDIEEDSNDIILESKYFLNGENVDEYKVKEEKFVSAKYERYKSFINYLGFENNRISDVDKIGLFLMSDLSPLKNIATLYLSEELQKLHLKKIDKFNLNLRYNTGMLDVCFDDLSYSDEELNFLISALRKKKKFVRLNNDTIINLETPDAQKLLNTVDEFNLDTNKLSDVQQIPLYESLKIMDHEIDDSLVEYNADDILKEILYSIAHYKESDYKVPSILENDMRTYQVEAYKWLKILTKYNLCGILADDMGLGKSLEIISLIYDDIVFAPTLIVCPKSLTYNWTNEFIKWKTNINVINISGSSEERKRIIKDIRNDEKIVFVTSYDSLKNDLEYYKNINFRFMILDEAQYIKNHSTLKAKSVKQINSEVRFVLTGTPIENTVVDLWSIFDFLMPHYLGNRNQFGHSFESGITIDRDDDVIARLVKKITPFILRRKKEDVLKDLPDKIEMLQFAEMGDEQRKLYEAQLLLTKNLIEAGKKKIEILGCLTRLRQLCVDPATFVDGYNGGSCKMELAESLITDLIEEGHKILVFSQFTTALDILAMRLDSLGISYFMITGKTEAKDRLDIANKFNGASKEKVVLISLKAGGTGLNLTGGDIVLHLDPWWNVAAENQASDRAHRIGQTRIVKVIKLVCQNSIEQRVVELQELKKDIISKVIANNDENIVNMNTEDIDFILS